MRRRLGTLRCNHGYRHGSDITGKCVDHPCDSCNDFLCGCVAGILPKIQLHCTFTDRSNLHSLCNWHGSIRDSLDHQPQHRNVHQPLGNVDSIRLDFFLHLVDGNTGNKIPQTVKYVLIHSPLPKTSPPQTTGTAVTKSQNKAM